MNWLLPRMGISNCSLSR